MSAFDFIICFASRLLRGLLAVHYFLYFIVSAFDFIICLASRLWRGPLAVQCFYLTMWQPLILHSMLSLAFEQDTGCTLSLYDHWLRHYFAYVQSDAI